jgi:transposase
MARTRRTLDERGEAAHVLAALKAGKTAGWQHERLLAIKWGLEGEVSLEQVAERLGRARSCIQRWYDRFRHGGLQGLVRRDKAPGRQSRLSPRTQGPTAPKASSRPLSARGRRQSVAQSRSRGGVATQKRLLPPKKKRAGG